MAKSKRRTDATTEPDKLIRQEAGSYRTADDRFAVREGDVGWFLVDTEQANEFGQELVHGPFGTLKAAREAISGARDRKVRSLRAPKARKERSEPAPAAPPSWIDELSKAEARRVRLLIGALEGEGVADAERLVRRDREGLLPAVAIALIERRLDALVEDLAGKERRAARELLGRAAAIVSSGGRSLPEPLPGWSLVEIGPDKEPPNRRIDLGE